MEQETREALVGHIIKQFGRHKKRDQIVRELCEEQGIPWQDAEELVGEVEASKGKQVARNQAPMLLVLGIVGLLGGVYLIYRNLGVIDMLGFVTGIDVDVAANARIEGGPRVRGNFILFGLGVLMFLGSFGGLIGVGIGMFKE